MTTYDTDANVYAALRAGASGFLVKDMPWRTSSPPSTWSPPETR